MGRSQFSQGLVAALCLLSAPALAQKPDLSQKGSELAEKLNPFPKPSVLTIHTALPWYGAGSLLCAAGGLIGGGATHELSNEEAASIVLSCVLPGIGPILVKIAYGLHPEWNRVHCEPLDRDKADLMMISGWRPKCWVER